MPDDFNRKLTPEEAEALIADIDQKLKGVPYESCTISAGDVKPKERTWQEERADVVAWLLRESKTRYQPENNPRHLPECEAVRRALRLNAGYIEEGSHVGAAKKEQSDG